MKKMLVSLLTLTLYSCATHNTEESTPVANANSNITANSDAACIGTTELAPALANQFEAVDDAQLLNEALGTANKGKLCQGKVYQSKEATTIPLFRAWNSTNPNSQLGQWWAFDKPAGEIAKYRSDYEICYQWSPLDKLVSCTLKPGTKVVIGTGQSAECSAYLTYPTSKAQQVYIENASASVINCTTMNGEFSWK